MREVGRGSPSGSLPCMESSLRCSWRAGPAACGGGESASVKKAQRRGHRGGGAAARRPPPPPDFPRERRGARGCTPHAMTSGYGERRWLHGPAAASCRAESARTCSCSRGESPCPARMESNEISLRRIRRGSAHKTARVSACGRANPTKKAYLSSVTRCKPPVQQPELRSRGRNRTKEGGGGGGAPWSGAGCLR